MFTKYFSLTLLVVLTVGSTSASAREQGDAITSTNGKINNYCLGGGDDRKVIPFDGIIHNPFKQTNHFMPDLDPPIKDGKLA